jgi:hypothetical protein
MSAVFLTIMKAKQTKPKKKPMTPDDFALLIQKDLGRMATKADLRGSATKQELAAIREEMATKKDLERFATKEDLETAFLHAWRPNRHRQRRAPRSDLRPQVCKGNRRASGARERA